MHDYFYRLVANNYANEAVVLQLRNGSVNHGKAEIPAQGSNFSINTPLTTFVLGPKQPLTVWCYINATGKMF